jgi:hypothetical protein
LLGERGCGRVSAATAAVSVDRARDPHPNPGRKLNLDRPAGPRGRGWTLCRRANVDNTGRGGQTSFSAVVHRRRRSGPDRTVTVSRLPNCLQINEQTISRDNTILKAVLTGLQLPITLTTRADPLIGEILSRNRQKAVCDPWKVNVGSIERLVDASLGTRGSATEFHKLLTRSAMGQSIPLVCQANTKAAYRFFSSP